MKNQLSSYDIHPRKLYQVRPLQLYLRNFEFISVLGEGEFGKVSLVRDRQSGQFHAIKQLSKHDIIQKKQIDHLRNELYILNSVQHPFIVKMRGMMQDSRYVYICLDYVYGGELFTLLRKRQRFGKLQSSFYAAQVVMMLEHLHSFNIIYRDLKPENLLISADGYLKLTDFGFAKEVTNRTYTLCGTPEYIAPEILKNIGHGKGADWWALGILIYEMLVGIDPFNADNPMDMYRKILRGDLKFPERFYRDAKSIIKHLLQRNLSRRYGNLSKGKLTSLTGRENASFL